MMDVRRLLLGLCAVSLLCSGLTSSTELGCEQQEELTSHESNRERVGASNKFSSHESNRERVGVTNELSGHKSNRERIGASNKLSSHERYRERIGASHKLSSYEGYRERRGASFNPRSNCNSWSKWINENHPSPSHRWEKERINTTVQADNCPILHGGHVTRFECMDGDNNITFTGNKTSSGWTQLHHCNVNELYVMCTVTSTSTSQCPDMSVRFYCYCDPITTTTSSSTTTASVRTTTAPISTSTPTTSTSMSSTITSTTWATDSTTVTFLPPILFTSRSPPQVARMTPRAYPFFLPTTIPSQPKTIATTTATTTNAQTPTAMPPLPISSTTPSTASSTSTMTSTTWATDSTTATYIPIINHASTPSTQHAIAPPLGFHTAATTTRNTLRAQVSTMPNANSVTNSTTTGINVVESGASITSKHAKSIEGEDELCYYYEPASGFDVGSTHISWWIINLVISILLFCIGCTALCCLYKRLRKNRKKRKASSVLPM